MHASCAFSQGANFEKKRFVRVVETVESLTLHLKRPKSLRKTSNRYNARIILSSSRRDVGRELKLISITLGGDNFAQDLINLCARG